MNYGRLDGPVALMGVNALLPRPHRTPFCGRQAVAYVQLGALGAGGFLLAALALPSVMGVANEGRWLSGNPQSASR
jgi:hypothetical protein